MFFRSLEWSRVGCQPLCRSKFEKTRGKRWRKMWNRCSDWKGFKRADTDSEKCTFVCIYKIQRRTCNWWKGVFFMSPFTIWTCIWILRNFLLFSCFSREQSLAKNKIQTLYVVHLKKKNTTQSQKKGELIITKNKEVIKFKPSTCMNTQKRPKHISSSPLMSWLFIIAFKTFAFFFFTFYFHP